MRHDADSALDLRFGPLLALDEPVFRPGDRIRVANRSPVGRYLVPGYLRNKTGSIESVIEPRCIDNEEEGDRSEAGESYYRIAFPMTEIWPHYEGSPLDALRIEVFENWLEPI